MIEASCHCGDVRLEVARRPRRIVECNCSICRRYGARWAYYSYRTVRFLGSSGATEVYVHGDRTLAFHRCRRCGCVSHHQRIEVPGEGRVGVNTRLMEPEAVAGVRVRLLDGASSWKYLD